MSSVPKKADKLNLYLSVLGPKSTTAVICMIVFMNLVNSLPESLHLLTLVM